jgi:hypothetical protein
VSSCTRCCKIVTDDIRPPRLRQICDSVSLIVRKKGEPGHHDDLLISNDDLVFDANIVAAPGWDKQAEIDRARAFGGDELVNKLIVK